jgi:4'-phosphopantetheinyl transferase
MVSEGEIHVWRIGAGTADLRDRSTLLARVLGYTPEIAIAEKGKPYLAATPRIRFSLSRTSGMALVAIALDAEVGVDIERVRLIPEWRDIAQAYFTPAEAAAVNSERQFLRQWTRLEAQRKALGVGLPAHPEPLAIPCPTVVDLELGEEYAAAVAAMAPGLTVRLH